MKFFRISIIIVTIMLFSIPVQAQVISGSVDYVSRYVWRGLDINSTPNLQPALDFSYEGFHSVHGVHIHFLTRRLTQMK